MAGPVEALPEVHPQFHHGLELLRPLHALGNHRGPQVLHHHRQASGQCPIPAIGVEMLHQRNVQLEPLLGTRLPGCLFLALGTVALGVGLLR